tara:strand:- start:1486 stop:2259 length:774 start_codon:yes stop_codon:yes gene_type:complete
MNKPLILVTNDDGITAPGIRKLVKIMNDFGDVYVVAPDSPQSAKSNAITLDKPIRCNSIKIDSGLQKEFACSGTPVDCVKLALNKVLTRKPDLCVSGINHGSNSSINVIYSGTVSAALEASLNGVPSLAFSILDHSFSADFSESEYFIRKVVKMVLSNKVYNNICLNVNIPKSILNQKIKGLKVCHQAVAKWKEEFIERKDAKGDVYYCLNGKFICEDNNNKTDEWALNNQYVSIVPVKFDLTSFEMIKEIQDLFHD